MKPVVEQKLLSIQLLRALAVLAVMISHIAYELKNLLINSQVSIDDKLFPGDFGVDLFFVISGFIMIYTTQGYFGEKGQAWSFIRRRIIRIVPLYWTVTCLMIVAVMIFPASIRTATSDVWQWFCSFFFIPYAREGDGLIRPVLGIGWSLQYEMFFYAIFAVGLLFKRSVGLILIVAAPFVFWGSSYIIGSSSTLWAFIGHPIIIEFSIGVVLGYLYLRGFRIPKVIGWMNLFIAFSILAALPGFGEELARSRHFYYGIPAAMFVCWAVLTRSHDQATVSRGWIEIGETSYATYLTHPFVIGITALIVKKMDLVEVLSPYNLIVGYSMVVILASLSVGYLTHYLFDLPITRFIAKIWRPSTEPSQK
ncbi:MAG: acyltransferase family protein [Nitratireductor sp.]